MHHYSMLVKLTIAILILLMLDFKMPVNADMIVWEMWDIEFLDFLRVHRI